MMFLAYMPLAERNKLLEEENKVFQNHIPNRYHRALNGLEYNGEEFYWDLRVEWSDGRPCYVIDELWLGDRLLEDFEVLQYARELIEGA